MSDSTQDQEVIPFGVFLHLDDNALLVQFRSMHVQSRNAFKLFALFFSVLLGDLMLFVGMFSLYPELQNRTAVHIWLLSICVWGVCMIVALFRYMFIGNSCIPIERELSRRGVSPYSH